MTDTPNGNALARARSRFAAAKAAYDQAFDAAEQAQQMRTIAFNVMAAAADDLAAVSRDYLNDWLVNT